MINGNMIGIGSAPLKTLILTDENGNEITGVCVENLTVFDATTNDVREGKTFVSDEGSQVGTKFIPPYYTLKGVKVIKSGNEFNMELSLRDMYNYTAMQCVICKYNTSLSNSVETDKGVIEDNVYVTNSTTPISVLSKDHENKTVKLGIVNDSTVSYIIRFFTYREEI